MRVNFALYLFLKQVKLEHSSIAPRKYLIRTHTMIRHRLNGTQPAGSRLRGSDSFIRPISGYSAVDYIDAGQNFCPFILPGKLNPRSIPKKGTP
jgi:hypothetical protein